MSLNPGCTFTNCSVITGPTVSLINLTVVDEPVQSVEYHWLWSVIGHPTLQGAVTEPGDRANINWNAIFGSGSIDKSIQYFEKPMYSGAIMLLNVSY